MTDDAVDAIQTIGDSIAEWQENLFTHSIWYTLVIALIAGLVAFGLVKLLGRLVRKRRQGNLRFFYKLINVVIITIAVVSVMMTITPLQALAKTILTGSGLLAVVIGIAAQAALSNLLSGISIGISRPFVIGETIEIIGQDLVGTVTEIGLRQTVIRDYNNRYIVVPNSVIDKAIIRTVQHEGRAVINYLQIGVGYQSDLAQAIAVIKKAVLAHKDFYDTRTPQQQQEGMQKDVTVAVMDLGTSSILLRASVWSKDAGTGFMMLSDLRQSIVAEYKRQGIEIPYAYQNVILKRETDEA